MLSERRVCEVERVVGVCTGHRRDVGVVLVVQRRQADVVRASATRTRIQNTGIPPSQTCRYSLTMALMTRA